MRMEAELDGRTAYSFTYNLPKTSEAVQKLV